MTDTNAPEFSLLAVAIESSARASSDALVAVVGQVLCPAIERSSARVANAIKELAEAIKLARGIEIRR